MKLVADSGGSKTAWNIISNGKINSITTSGMNPYYHSDSSLSSIVESQLIPEISTANVTEIYFYGAGCSSEKSCRKISQALNKNFQEAIIHVNHDLLGAARALCQEKAGIVGILGTGSNSCFYDGNKIATNVPSLGYVLGDEGGGAYMGKYLLRDFIRENLPENIHQKMKSRGFTKSGIENKIYLEDNPISFLSGFAPFIRENIEMEYFNSLVTKTFNKFIENCLSAYENLREYPIHFTGSIAYHFKEHLTMVLNEHNLRLGTVVKTPLDGLTKYHADIK